MKDGLGGWGRELRPGTGSFLLLVVFFLLTTSSFLKVSEHLRRLGALLGNTCTSPGKWWYRPEVSYCSGLQGGGMNSRKK